MKRTLLMVAALLVLSAWPLWAAEAVYPPPVNAMCVRVIDGDTIKVRIGGNKIESVRLLGIDAPERKHPGYTEARTFVVKLCEGKSVRLEFDKKERDRFGRLLAYVYAPINPYGKHVHVNEALINEGHAVYYPGNAKRHAQALSDAYGLHIAYQLACLNAGHDVPKDDTTIYRFRYLLDSISKHIMLGENWADKRQQIANQSVHSTKMLREDYGKEVELLEFIEAMNKRLKSSAEEDYGRAALLLIMTYGGLD